MPRRAKIDWRSVRRRIEAASRATESAIHPSPDRLRRRLEERTRTIAADLERFVSGETAAVVSFVLSEVRYALPATYVREVIQLPVMTPVPRTPSYVIGVIDLRGHLIPVFDLAKMLDLPDGAPGEASRILVCGRGHADLGFLVDQVSSVDELFPADLKAALDGISDGPSWTRGKDMNGRTVIDGAGLLEDERLIIG